MQTAFSPNTELILIRLLLQIATIVAASRLVGTLFYRLGQVRTMGEITAGIMLGPSLLGWIFPGLLATLFPPASPTTPNILPYFSHIGLVLTLFLIGMEFDFAEVPQYLRHVGSIAVAALITPVAAGALLAYWIWDVIPGETGFLPYALFLGISSAITAIPIMGRVLMELRLTRSRVGVLGISTGAIKDLLTWFLMAVVIGIARPPIAWSHVGAMIGQTLLLALFMLTAGRAFVRRLLLAWPVERGQVHSSLMSILLIMLFVSSAATSHIGIFAIFGAFLAGVVVSEQRELAEAVSHRIQELTLTLFLPLFFTYTGLRADFTQLTPSLVVWIFVISAVTGLANAVPSYLLSRRAGLERPEAITFASLINMPGLMILIVLNIGYDLKVLPPLLFSVLLGVAMIRNLLVTPIIRRVMKDQINQEMVPS